MHHEAKEGGAQVMIAAVALLVGNTLVLFLCMWKLQSVLLVLQQLAEFLMETKEEKIGFRSETAPPAGTEGDEIELEYQTGEPLTYDQACRR